MISSDEIKEHAARVQLQPTVVEKDYALGWMLAGISQHIETKDTWIFKGGTCLKKCYFETFRFSEDLDFTCIDFKRALTEHGLIDLLNEVGEWVYSQSGVEIPKNGIAVEILNNPRGTVSVQGKISYRGPLRPNIRQEHWPRIKIDLTLDELLVKPSIFRAVEHPYSDTPTAGISVRAYSYEEVFAEKTRALAQRLRPRDLYDVIHLHRNKDMKPDASVVREILEKKCTHRGIAVPTISIIETHENRSLLQSEWENQLKHQLPMLPPFEEFLSSLPYALDWISGVVEVASPQISVSSEEVGAIRSESIRSLVAPGIETSNLDKVRFAAANRLLINLGYQGSYRLIEPYSFARSSDGNLLLYAVKNETGESRSYRWDRVESMEITQGNFAPSFEVEITSSGSLPIKQLVRKQQGPLARHYSRPISNGPTYIFKCTRCGKQFRRKTRDLSLKEHKDPSGRRCYGYGSFLRTEI